MLNGSFIFPFLLIYLQFKLLISSQKPFKIYFYNSLSNQNIPIYNDIADNSSLSNQEIFNYYYKHNIITKICLGTPKNCFNTEISFSTKRTWICGSKSDIENKNYFFSSKSSTFQKLNDEEKIMTSQEIKTGSYSRDLIKIGNNTIHNEYFDFFVVKECKNSDFGELAIGKDNYFSSNFSHLSIMDQLKIKKLIGSGIISIRYINNTFGEILLGVDYDNFNRKFIDFDIPSIDNSIIISHFIQSIYILKQITNVNDDSEEETVFEKKINIECLNHLRFEIDFGSSLISLPEEIFDNLIDTVFIKYIHNKKICEIRVDINPNIKYFVCNHKILNTNLDKLVLVIDSETHLKIDLGDIFLPLNNKNEILFGIISEKNINYIYIGEIFLRNYVIYLNGEKNSMKFYNKDILKVENNEKYSFILIILIGICLILVMYYMLSITCEKKSGQKETNSNMEKFLRKNYVQKKHKKLKRYKRYLQ
jgi:hypothetical protein